MRQFDCPQCSAPIPFETPGGVFAVCPSCHSMVVRSDIGLEAIGTMAELPPDHSPLQLGARGVFRGQHFKLLGRLRVRWEDGVWDEWYADFGGEGYGWVAATQGFFQISQSASTPPTLSGLEGRLKPGEALSLAGIDYEVSDLKQATAVAGEGELPFVAKPGEKWLTADFTGPGRRFAGAEWHGDEVRFFQGLSAMPEEIQWEGLRPVPGWGGEPVPIETNLTQALNCPNCGGVVQLKQAGLTVTLACSHCGSLIDVHQPQAAIGQKILKARDLPPAPLPLGRRGTIDGVEWEVLGCLWRKDPYARWHEILLYNPWHGVAWLTESGGHWNFIKRIPEAAEDDGDGRRFQGLRYRLFDLQETEVIQVTGEFYWRVRVGEKATVADYIAPPRILSSETYPGLEEQTWSAGRYLPAIEVGVAFNQPQRQGEGVYLNAPNPWAERRAGLLKIAALALLAAIVLEALFSTFSSRRTVLHQNLTPQQAGVISAPAVSGTFDLRGGRRADIELKTQDPSALQQMTVNLVREADGASYRVPMPGAPSASEAASRGEVSSSLPAVPGGKYHLALHPLPSAALPTSPVEVTLQQGGLFTSNFVICLLALLAWPAWAWYRSHRFEADRWTQSDYTP